MLICLVLLHIQLFYCAEKIESHMKIIKNKCRRYFFQHTTFCLINIFLLIAPLCVFGQENIDQYKAQLTGSANDSVKIQAYYRLGKHYEYINLDSANYFLKEGLAFCNARKNRLGIAWMNMLNAVLDQDQGRLDVTITRLNDAMAIFEEHKNIYGQACVYRNLGVAYGMREDYNIAQKYVLQSLQKGQELHDDNIIGSAYLKLGAINEKKNNLSKALEDYDKALKLSQKTNAQEEVCNILNNIGVVYGKSGDFKKARSYFDQALQISRQSVHNINVTVLALTNLGIAYDKEGNRKEALRSLQEAIDILEKQKLPAQTARALLSMGLIFLDDQPETALKYFHQAYDKCQQVNGMSELRKEILSTTYETEKLLGHYREALSALEMTEHIKDSLDNNNSAIEISNLETIHELKESQSKVDKLNLEQKANALRNKIVLLLTLFLLGIIILMVFNQMKLRKLYVKLSAREKELEVHNRTKDKLFSIIGHDLKGPVSSAATLVDIIKGNMTDNDDNQELLDILKNQLNASYDILEKLLLWGNSQIKGVKIKSTTFQPLPVVINNVALLENSLTDKKITLNNNISPDISLFGDADHFEFIIRNLISNAIKFTYAGGTITLNAEEKKEEPIVIFSVNDNGMGIERSLIANIFMLDNQSTVGTANESGTSIGLMISREFAISNGGTMWVESEKDKGSTFYFSFRKAQ